jgi:hypothetical protein
MKNNLTDADIKVMNTVRRTNHQTHGLSHTPPHSSWQHMKMRCDNKNTKEFKDYGAKGITYDKNWTTFIGFWKDMGGSYRIGLTLDRISNSKGYFKENCRWVTRREQALNRDCIRFWKGRSYSQVSRDLGGIHNLVVQRLMRGWSIKDSCTLPARPKRRNNYDK